MPELTATEALEVIRTGLQVDTPEARRISLAPGASLRQHGFATRLKIPVEVAQLAALNVLARVDAPFARVAIDRVVNDEWLASQKPRVELMQRHLARACKVAFIADLLPSPRRMNMRRLGLWFTAECLANRGILEVTPRMSTAVDPTLYMGPQEVNGFVATAIELGLSFKTARQVIAENKHRKSAINVELRRLSGRGTADSARD